MSHMLPEGGEVMRRAACGELSPAPAPICPPTAPQRSENKELLRQQLLSAKERQNTERTEVPKLKQSRNRQKNRWKLKFHHQALPQEYLDHYEQSLQKQAKLAPKTKPDKPKEDPAISKENFKVWAQKLAGIQNETNSVIASNMARSPKNEDRKRPNIPPNKIVTYEDLPYMGEMTLNNSKPRRGRKPKKADICHLIYENYGTVVPGQPPPQIVDKLSQLTMCPPFRNDTPKTDLQNKIISSLLERKLSQEQKKRLELSPQSFASPEDPLPEAPVTIAGPLHSDEEPLNLCIRDLHELKIQIQKKFGNIYSSLPEVKTELDESKNEQSNAISVIQRNTSVVSSTASSSPDLSRQNLNIISPTLSEPVQTSEGEKMGCVYWPNLYMHPLALQTQLMYYQRLAAAGQLPIPSEDRPGSSTSSSPIDENKNKLVLKEITELLDPKLVQEDAKKSPDPAKMKRASPNPTQGPVKRKRSAIFIPPVPSKSSSATPTAEVSICKFKFTGGSKPSLQEKKMLSVDAGGNFRYYNGTGSASKGHKGYEYMQRDNTQGKTEISESLQRKSPVLNKDDLSKKKRKSRKSLQREKLEQTFKEKGFLIQTQQLQSAEGATYCKFRQLRKFTRYLFRSWKDYLPGELDDKGNETRPIPQEDQPSGSSSLPTAGEWG